MIPAGGLIHGIAGQTATSTEGLLLIWCLSSSTDRRRRLALEHREGRAQPIRNRNLVDQTIASAVRRKSKVCPGLC